MKITVKKTIEEEQEITTPVYRKSKPDDGHVYKIIYIGENEFCMLWMNERGNVSICTIEEYNYAKYFDEGWEEASAFEFNERLNDCRTALWMMTPADFMQQPTEIVEGNIMELIPIAPKQNDYTGGEILNQIL